jgi:hypothetical protein
MTNSEKIVRIEKFRELVLRWSQSEKTEDRSQINREKTWIRQQVIEARCFKSLTIGPPPAIGGLVLQGVDAFEMMFNPPWHMNLVPTVVDMLDATIGVLTAEPEAEDQKAPSISMSTVPNYAFVAMPMDRSDPTLDDVLDAIKEAGHRCGIQAERVDEPATNERITDRILESIDRAEFVIADLTHAKPNVYYEAGYAHARGKTPIYIAREGTKLEFDLKDYPVIFFQSLKRLKDDLEKRLRGLAVERSTCR